MAGSRSPMRRKWPPNLYPSVSKGRTYYRYKNPKTGKFVSLGSDFEAAKKVVLAQNAKLVEDPVARLMAKIERPARTLGEHLIWYDEEVLANKTLAEKTRKDTAQMITTIARRIGVHRDIGVIDRRAIAEFLGSFPPRMSNRYRSLLGQIFRHAVAQGLRDDNPVDMTIKRDFEVKRERLPWEHFERIYAAAAPWFKCSLDLARWSLQRREDLTLIEASAWTDGKLAIRQKKVEGHGTGLLRITPGPQLRMAIIGCLNSAERGDCPFLIHKVPERIVKADWKRHHKQVAPEMLTRTFAELRDQVIPEYARMAPGERPSFHEIRAMGADHYRETLKWPEPKIQLLLGHSSEQMTRVYLDRHGERWTEVEAA